nr:HAMP domain-containing sensor histidine kinase [Rhizobium halophytocola]
MRCALLAFVPKPFVLPCLLLLVVDPTTALPLGFALGLALLLLAAGLVLAVSVVRDEPEDIAAHPSASRQSVPSALLPGLVLRLDAQGHVVSADGRDRDALFRQMREPYGRPLAEQFHVADRIGFLQALDALRLGEDDAIVELRLQRPSPERQDGPFMMVRLDMVAERGADGGLDGVFVQLRDATQTLIDRLEMRALRQAADAAEETKARFLAAVSHELRTPLNAILGFSDILGGEYFGKLQNDRQREYVQLIHQSGTHLLSVVNAMLDMSKIEAGRFELQKEDFPIAQTIRECEAMLALQARDKNVVLSSRFGPDLGHMVADPRALRQILINLVGNAIKFTETGGAVMIDAAVADGMLTVAVSDTGIGIAEDKLPLVGRPFAQIHNDYARRYEGSGLGLSLVKGLIGLHGGRFKLASRQGEGTVVTISLPLDGHGELAQPVHEDTAPVEFPPRLKDGDRHAPAAEEALWVGRAVAAARAS